jgi:protein TonB
MPRDLFGEVTRPSVSIGNRKWYTVPVSLLSHSLVIAMFLVLPILAAPYMPHVLEDNDVEYLVDVLPPPPPPPAIRPPQQPAPVAQPDAFPLVTPTTIAPEPLDTPLPESPHPGVIGGDPNVTGALEPPPRVAAPPQPPQPVRVGFSGVRTPVKVSGLDPVYPPIAQQVRQQGIVIIEATIGQDGRVTNTRVLRSIPLLDQAALDAVRSWEYTPTLLNGVPVPVVMTVTVHFTLK